MNEIGLLAFADAAKCTELGTLAPAAGDVMVTEPEAAAPTVIVFVDL